MGNVLAGLERTFRRRPWLLLVGVVACSSGDAPPLSPSSPQDAVAPVGAMHDLGRLVVTAMRDANTRRLVYDAVKSSPYVEWRVPLRRTLSQDPAFRAAMFGNGGDEGARWQALADVLPELELYFPHESYRAAWDGGENLQLAVTLGGHDGFVIYDLQGKFRLVPEDDRPSVPTLVLGRSEIDYDDVASAVRGGSRTGSGLLKRMRDLRIGIPFPYRGAMVCTEGEEGCEEGGGGGGGGGGPGCFETSQIRCDYNTYLTQIHLLVDHDPFLSGSNELEVYGRNSPESASEVGLRDCRRYTNIDEGEEYTFPAGEFSNRIFRAAMKPGMGYVYVRVLEDDGAPCEEGDGDDPVGHVYFHDSEYGYTLETLNWETFTHDLDVSIWRGQVFP